MEAAPKMPLELRAKGLTAAEIQSALEAGVNFRLSTKYWMEQMGLPFHPTHVNPQDQANRRHGYADLLVYPQQYKMNWQLWNGGTARIFLWGDPDYARRFLEPRAFTKATALTWMSRWPQRWRPSRMT